MCGLSPEVWDIPNVFLWKATGPAVYVQRRDQSVGATPDPDNVSTAPPARRWAHRSRAPSDWIGPDPEGVRRPSGGRSLVTGAGWRAVSALERVLRRLLISVAALDPGRARHALVCERREHASAALEVGSCGRPLLAYANVGRPLWRRRGETARSAADVGEAGAITRPVGGLRHGCQGRVHDLGGVGGVAEAHHVSEFVEQ